MTLGAARPVVIRSSAPSQQPAGHQTKGAGTEPRPQRMKVNKAYALPTNLERANRRHPDSSAAARALGF